MSISYAYTTVYRYEWRARKVKYDVVDWDYERPRDFERTNVALTNLKEAAHR